MTRCSVIIPTCRRPEALASCLTALDRQTFRDFEVVVCDDSGDAELTRRICAGRTLVATPRLGPAAARNRGAEAAGGQFLVFLDDDCLAEPDWLARLDPALQSGTLVAGLTINGYPDNLASEIGELILEVGLETFNPGPGSLYFFRSTNVALCRRDFQAMGGWDVNFRTAEDREFCHRWQLAGGSMRMVREAVVRHMSHLSLGGFSRRHFAYGRGAFQFHRQRSATGAGDWSFLRYYAEVWSAIQRRSDRRLAGCLLFSLWQAMNLSGFLWELAGSLYAPRRPGSAAKCTPPALGTGDGAIAGHCVANPV